MEDLIAALQIFLRYTESEYPTNCEHDTLYVMVDPEGVSKEDKSKLAKLGFFVPGDGGCFVSYRFGSS